jgi:hypothetical protein
MVVGMKVDMKISFVKNCDLRQQNVWLNIAVRLCSAVGVLRGCINILWLY